MPLEGHELNELESSEHSYETPASESEYLNVALVLVEVLLGSEVMVGVGGTIDHEKDVAVLVAEVDAASTLKVWLPWASEEYEIGVGHVVKVDVSSAHLNVTPDCKSL
jgi:hypothetical protein